MGNKSNRRANISRYREILGNFHPINGLDKNYERIDGPAPPLGRRLRTHPVLTTVQVHINCAAQQAVGRGYAPDARNEESRARGVAPTYARIANASA